MGLDVALKYTVMGSSLEDCFDRLPFLVFEVLSILEYSSDFFSTEFLRLVDLELGFELYTPEDLHSQELRAFSMFPLFNSCSVFPSPLMICRSVPLVIFPLVVSVEIEFFLLLAAEVGRDE